MMDSKFVRNIYSSLPKQIWEIVYLVGFYYKKKIKNKSIQFLVQ
jgi:hypothetical protein